MKKLISLALLGLTTAVFAQGTATPIYRFSPLLSGYNVLVQTNVTAGYGVTNTLYTTAKGQVLYSLTNNTINGTLYTNGIAGDAFKVVALSPDVNGDIVANASVFIMVGNTNFIPQVITNSMGMWMVTNTWPLIPANYQAWMYPATTNYYPAMGANTDTVTVTLYKAPALTIDGSTTGAAQPLWETTGTFSFSLTMNGVTPKTLCTNLPTSFTQGAAYVYAKITTSGAATNDLVNQLGIIQPVP